MRVDFPFSPNAWHDVAIESIYAPSSVSQKGSRVRFDGVESGWMTSQEVYLPEGEGGFEVGARSLADGGAGQRAVVIDDFSIAPWTKR